MGRYKVQLILTLIFLLSCAPSKKVLTDLNFDYAISKINHRKIYIKTISAKGSITIDSPELSNSANIRVNFKKPDTLFVRIEAIFGISFGEVKIYGNRFELVDRFNDRVISGNVNDYLKRHLAFEITFEEIIDILLASPQIGEVENFETTDDGFLIHTRKNDKIMILKVDHEGELRNFAFMDDGGYKIFEVEYSKYEKFDDVTLPRVVKIYDEFRRAIYLNFSEIKVNDEK